MKPHGADGVERLLYWVEDNPTIVDLLALTADQVQALAQFIEARGLEAPLSETFDLAQSTGISHERTLDLLRYIGFLADQRLAFGLTPEEVVDDLAIFVERRNELEPHEFEERRDALLALLSDHQSTRREWLSSRIVPKATDFLSVCDLRPMFRRGSTESVEELLPVAFLRVRVSSELRSESDLCFQVDLAGLQELEECIRRVRDKMATLERLAERLLELGGDT